MEILGEGVLDKALAVPEKLDEKRRKVFEVIDDEYFKQSDIDFPRYYPLKFKTEFNVSHFITVNVKK